MISSQKKKKKEKYAWIASTYRESLARWWSGDDYYSTWRWCHTPTIFLSRCTCTTESAPSSAILNTMKMIYEREKFSGIFHSRSGPDNLWNTHNYIETIKRSPRDDNPTKLDRKDFVSITSKIGFKASMNTQIWMVKHRFDRSLRLLGTRQSSHLEF